MASERGQLDQLVEAVLAGTKYASVSRDLIDRIGRQELDKRRSLKEAIKQTRRKLHQVGGAYVGTGGSYGGWAAALQQAAQTGDEEGLRRFCRAIMAHHTSTRERLPILNEFYQATLGPLAPIRSVLDVACGLNPLAIPWMPLAPGADYIACDAHGDLLRLVADLMVIAGVRGQTRLCDVTQTCPDQPVDVALVLKALPCLGQIDRSAGTYVLRTVNARYVLVSFPVHSLGGRQKGMAATYEAHFRHLLGGPQLAGRYRLLERFTFASEVAFLLEPEGSC
jgi:16S rRNA (guanine(1405)-N(7))-methyltransferase